MLPNAAFQDNIHAGRLYHVEGGGGVVMQLVKEGDFARNRSATLILSINIQITPEILKMMRYSLLIMA